jgi:thioredoxin 1
MFKKLLLVLTATILLTNCSNGQTKGDAELLSATEFASKVNEVPNAVIIDVRTPGEFDLGHLINALNYNWNGDSFEQQISQLDKSKPVFVYCLSGGRSAAAVSKLKANSFEVVYELEGGIKNWRVEKLPESTKN